MAIESGHPDPGNADPVWASYGHCDITRIRRSFHLPMSAAALRRL